MRTSAYAMAGLSNELTRHTYLRNQLLTEIPDLDSETLSDTLEGLTDLREMIGEILRSALEDEALASGLGTRLEQMKARHDRLKNRAKRKRAMALNAMTEGSILRLVTDDLTASLRQGSPTLEIDAEDRLPEHYWKPQPPKLDRLGLLQDLKAGQAIDGAFLKAPQMHLSVRAK